MEWGKGDRSREISGGSEHEMVVERSGGSGFWVCLPGRVLGRGEFLSLREGRTVEQAEAEGPNVGFLKNARLPAYLGKPREGVRYGSTKLDGAVR
jgi:hypothetical protein